MPGEAEVLKPAEKTAAVVPFIFYDLIARILPGTTLLLVYLWWDGDFDKDAVFEIAKLMNLAAGPAGLLVSMVLGAGYFLGMLVTATVGGLTYMLAGKVTWYFVLRQNGPKGKVEKFYQGRTDRPVLNSWGADLNSVEKNLETPKRENVQFAAQILPKMRAETNLFCNLMGGLLIWIGFLYVIRPQSIDWISVMIALLVLLWAIRTRYKAYIVRLLSFY